jgi:hypothetical protein
MDDPVMFDFKIHVNTDDNKIFSVIHEDSGTLEFSGSLADCYAWLKLRTIGIINEND